MPVSLWLRPEPIAAAALDAAIATYARAAGRTPFPAHITLASGEAAIEDEISFMCRDFSGFSLKADGVLQAGTFFQVFALCFVENAALKALKTQAMRCLNAAHASEYPPHLSLTYGLGFDPNALVQIANNFADPIMFDRVMLVTYDALDATQAGVAAWRYSPEMPLG